MATRQRIKPLNPTADTVQAQAANEAKRKRESKARLKADKAEQAPAKPTKPVKQEPTAEQLAAKKAAEHEAYLKVLREDAAALGVDPDAYVAEQLADVPKQDKYAGPMLALVQARKAYVKGANGNPHCGDEMSTILQGLSREDVVSVLLRFMELETNPYLHLNPGQQSMNLRNKARGQIKNGLRTMTELQARVIAWNK
jgi:hypothetical protein